MDGTFLVAVICPETFIGYCKTEYSILEVLVAVKDVDIGLVACHALCTCGWVPAERTASVLRADFLKWV